MEKRYLGLDIGGTSCKMGIVTDSGIVTKEGSVDVAFDDYETPIIDTVLKASIDFVDEPIDGIGISATGQIDSYLGKVIGSNGYIKNYEGSNFKEVFEKQFHVPTYVLNDANCMLLAETWNGVAKGYNHVLGLTLGTGIGGGILVDGKILLGRQGIAGELGHISINSHGEQCNCGNIGCFEREASTLALVRKAKKALNKDVDGLYLFSHLEDPTIKQLIDDWLNDLAVGIVSLMHVFNPEIVVIGGAVSVQEEALMNPLRDKINSMAMPRFKENCLIVSASTKNQAGLLGAVYFMKEKIKR